MSIGLEYLKRTDEMHPDNLITTFEHPIILNDQLDVKSAKDKIIKYVSTVVSDDIDMLPSCQCETSKEPMSIGMALGADIKICKICNTPIELPFEKEIKPFVFVRAPEGMAKFIDFAFLLTINAAFTRKNFSAVRYLMDKRYAIRDAYIIDYLESNGITERGYNYFVNNLKDIIEVLSSCDKLRTKVIAKDKMLVRLLDEIEDDILTNYIYLPNKSLMLLDDTNSFKYMHASMRPLINASMMFSAIDVDDELTPKNKENRTVTAVFALLEFWHIHLNLMLSGQENIFRKHVYSLRSVWGMRVVMTSDTFDTAHDVIRLPWAPTIQMLSHHIVGQLCNRHQYTIEEALSRIAEASTTYDSLIDSILTDIEQTNYEKCIPVIVQRYPTLLPGNISLMRGIHKTDPSDLTASQSPLAITSSNMDFDGDQGHIALVKGEKLQRDMYKLRKHVYNLDLRNLRTLSRFYELTNQCVSVTHSYLTDPDDAPTHVKLSNNELSKLQNTVKLLAKETTEKGKY